MTLDELSKMRDDALIGLTPNDNIDGDWKAKRLGETEARICGPLYASRQSRMRLGTIDVDGLSTETAQLNSLAIADYLVACANYVNGLLTPPPPTYSEGVERREREKAKARSRSLWEMRESLTRYVNRKDRPR